MRRYVWKRFASVLVMSGMLVSAAVGLCGCENGKNSQKKEDRTPSKEETVTLDVFSEISSFAGVQGGWMADILKEKFGIKLNIIPASEETYNEMKKNGSSADIMYWSSLNYHDAVKRHWLYDWNKNGLLDKHGSYIKEHMPDALNKNQELTRTITNGDNDTLYGFGSEVAASSKDHEPVFYTWDLRWDIYKKLGYPKVKNLEDYEKLMKDMVKACPKDDANKKTYAASLWSVWDPAENNEESLAFHMKLGVSAYYGYDSLGIGFYDVETGKYHDALEKNGPYLRILKYYNNLYQAGLLDPASRTQEYEDVIKKVENGGVVSSFVNYSGSLAYNTPKHKKAGKLMHSMKPREARPIAYGGNPQGSDSFWTIGANTRYPEKCMELLNWLCTPEGRLTYQYGPRDVCWKYQDKKTVFTELGKKCSESPKTKLENGYRGTFTDGTPQLPSTWTLDSSNPETDGETYNSSRWESNLPKPETEIEKDWCEKTQSGNAEDYWAKESYTVSPATSFREGERSEKLQEIWKKVTVELCKDTWKAIYAKTDSQYQVIVDKMIKKCEKNGYQACVKWSAGEADRRKSLEDALIN